MKNKKFKQILLTVVAHIAAVDRHAPVHFTAASTMASDGASGDSQQVKSAIGNASLDGSDCSPQTVGPQHVICNGVLCYIFCKMDIMIQATLVKLGTDHFESTVIDAAKTVLYDCNAISNLGQPQGGRRR